MYETSKNVGHIIKDLGSTKGWLANAFGTYDPNLTGKLTGKDEPLSDFVSGHAREKGHLVDSIFLICEKGKGERRKAPWLGTVGRAVFTPDSMSIIFDSGQI